LRGKTAFVTGAGRNIGRAIARELASEGARIGVNVAQKRHEADETVALIRDAGGEAIALVADVADPGQIEGAVAALAEAFGGVDILVNNAAIRPYRPLMEITVDEWDKVFAVNLRGPFLCAQKCAPYMVANRFGRIINISGVDAYWGTANRLHNVSTKAGIVGLTRALAAELVDYGVTANVVVPGVFDTSRPEKWYPAIRERRVNRMGQVLMAREGRVEELASLVRFLASEESSYITGQEFHINGGGWPTKRGDPSEHSTFPSPPVLA
jgi:NAD(P)-dependent dehydrogenase (short-subunit alcohol dehydrogenase family)